MTHEYQFQFLCSSTGSVVKSEEMTGVTPFESFHFGLRKSALETLDVRFERCMHIPVREGLLRNATEILWSIILKATGEYKSRYVILHREVQ